MVKQVSFHSECQTPKIQSKDCFHSYMPGKLHWNAYLWRQRFWINSSVRQFKYTGELFSWYKFHGISTIFTEQWHIKVIYNLILLAVHCIKKATNQITGWSLWGTTWSMHPNVKQVYFTISMQISFFCSLEELIHYHWDLDFSPEPENLSKKWCFSRSPLMMWSPNVRAPVVSQTPLHYQWIMKGNNANFFNNFT